MNFFGDCDYLFGRVVEEGCGCDSNHVGVELADFLAEGFVGEFFCLAVDNVYFVAFFFGDCAKVCYT